MKEKEVKEFVSFLQRIEKLKRMVFSKGDITYNTGVNDVKKVFLLCMKERKNYRLVHVVNKEYPTPDLICDKCKQGFRIIWEMKDGQEHLCNECFDKRFFGGDDGKRLL